MSLTDMDVTHEPPSARSRSRQATHDRLVSSARGRIIVGTKPGVSQEQFAEVAHTPAVEKLLAMRAAFERGERVVLGVGE